MKNKLKHSAWTKRKCVGSAFINSGKHCNIYFSGKRPSQQNNLLTVIGVSFSQAASL